MKTPVVVGAILTLIALTGCSVGTSFNNQLAGFHLTVDGGYIPDPDSNSGSNDTGFIPENPEYNPGSTSDPEFPSEPPADTTGDTASTPPADTSSDAPPADTSGDQASNTDTSNDGGVISDPDSGTPGSDTGEIPNPDSGDTGSDTGTVGDSGSGDTSNDSGSTGGDVADGSDSSSGGDTSSDSGSSDTGSTDGGTVGGGDTGGDTTDGGTVGGGDTGGDVADGGTVGGGDSSGGDSDGGSTNPPPTEDNIAYYCPNQNGKETVKVKLMSRSNKGPAALADAANPVLAMEIRYPSPTLDHQLRSDFKNMHSPWFGEAHAHLMTHESTLAVSINLRERNLWGPKFPEPLNKPVSLRDLAEFSNHGFQKVWVTFYVCDDTNRDGKCSDEQAKDQLTAYARTYQLCHIPSAVPIVVESASEQNHSNKQCN